MTNGCILREDALTEHGTRDESAQSTIANLVGGASVFLKCHSFVIQHAHSVLRKHVSSRVYKHCRYRGQRRQTDWNEIAAPRRSNRERASGGGGGIHRQKEGWKGGRKRGRKKGSGVWGSRREEKGAGKMDRQISGRSKGASKRCRKTSQEKSEKRRERVRESCVKRSVSEMLPCWRPRPNCARA